MARALSGSVMLLAAVAIATVGCEGAALSGIDAPDSVVPADLSTSPSADIATAGNDMPAVTTDMAVGPDLTAVADLALIDQGGPLPDLAVGPADLAAVRPDLAGSCPNATQSCYTGKMNTQGVGVCRAGVSFCMNGTFGPCVGQVVQSPESCNGLDDDCNGMADDGLGVVSCGIGACRTSVPACVNGKASTCTPGAAGMEVCADNIDNNCDGQVDEGCGCVYVAPSGNDNNPGTAASPKRSISAAIAVAGTNGLPSIVCVASGPACPSSSNYAEDVVMKNGVSVYGGYQATGNVWPRAANCVTGIVSSKPLGLHFPKSVTSATSLDGFTVLAHGDPTSAAITIEGSTGAVVSNNTITGGGTATSYGVNIIDSMGTAATPTLHRNAIMGGPGATASIGVHSLNSAPILQNHCSTFDNSGRCTIGCFTSTYYVRARPNNNTGLDSYGVLLESSPGAVVSASAVCGNAGTGNVAGVRITGAAANVLVRNSLITGGGVASQVAGVWADPCAAASPWLLNNTQIAGNSGLKGGRADGVRAIGDCHVRVDSNVLIVGGQESANNDANGVYCALDPNTKIASRCTVLGNTEIRGSTSGFPPTSTGVRCDDGACARIESNGLITAYGAQKGYGVRLGVTDALVNANRIEAGCSLAEGTGIWASDSYARIQNNAISGVTSCPNGMVSTAPSYAVRVFNGAGPREVDIHSNDLFPGGSGNCTGHGIAFDVIQGGAPPLGPGSRSVYEPQHTVLEQKPRLVVAAVSETLHVPVEVPGLGRAIDNRTQRDRGQRLP